MNIDMGNLLKLNFWFNMTPGNLTQGALRLIIIFLAVLLIGVVIFKILKNRKRNLYYKIWN